MIGTSDPLKPAMPACRFAAAASTPLTIPRHDFTGTTSSKFDTVRDLAVHLGVQARYECLLSACYASVQVLRTYSGPPQAWFRSWSADTVLLFDIESDPEERFDRSAQEPHVVAQLRARAAEIAASRPPQQRYWMTVDRDTVWPSTLRQGKCSMNPRVEREEHCVFAHPWIDDGANLDEIKLVFGASAWPFVRSVFVQLAKTALLPTCLLACLGYFLVVVTTRV